MTSLQRRRRRPEGRAANSNLAPQPHRALGGAEPGPRPAEARWAPGRALALATKAFGGPDGHRDAAGAPCHEGTACGEWQLASGARLDAKVWRPAAPGRKPFCTQSSGISEEAGKEWTRATHSHVAGTASS
mmetsp:Transcript_21052/g.63919  ORF Transcript_21052/g.63919 Transcript_21052/m.63919 type:complete len:131 (+) Transcript_21052:843-1235(+)